VELATASSLLICSTDYHKLAPSMSDAMLSLL